VQVDEFWVLMMGENFNKLNFKNVKGYTITLFVVKTAICSAFNVHPTPRIQHPAKIHKFAQLQEKCRNYLYFLPKTDFSISFQKTETFSTNSLFS